MDTFDKFQQQLNEISRMIINEFTQRQQVDTKFGGKLKSPCEGVDYDEISRL